MPQCSYTTIQRPVHTMRFVSYHMSGFERSSVQLISSRERTLTRLQQFVIILNSVGISNLPQHAQDVVIFKMKLITLPLWSIFKVVCYFHAKTIWISGIVFSNFLLWGLLFEFRLKETLVSWNSKELIIWIISKLHHFTFLSDKSTKIATIAPSIELFRSRIVLHISA